jgi:hypothetical protein
MRKQIAINVGGMACSLIPGEGHAVFPTGFLPGGPGPRIVTSLGQQSPGMSDPLGHVADGRVSGCRPTYLAQHREVRSQYRRAASKRLNHRQAKAFCVGRQQHKRHVSIQGRQLLMGDEGQHANVLGHAKAQRQRFLSVRKGTAHPVQNRAWFQHPQVTENLQQEIDPLAQNRAPDMEKTDLLRAWAAGLQNMIDKAFGIGICGFEQ